jgi:hypothetical protein
MKEQEKEMNEREKLAKMNFSITKEREGGPSYKNNRRLIAYWLTQ